MQILIHDASVLIDLISTELLETALSLPYRMKTTDFVKDEIKESKQQEILDQMIIKQKIEVIYSSPKELNTIAELHASNSRLSFSDCSILFHARQQAAIILSGDNLLRAAYENK